MLTFEEKLTAFAWLLEYEQLERLTLEGLDCEANRENAKTSIKIGRVWARVDVGNSGKYMVALMAGITQHYCRPVEVGDIVGIKAYGVPHFGHRFGSLDSIHEWDWRGYRAGKAGLSSRYSRQNPVVSNVIG